MGTSQKIREYEYCSSPRQQDYAPLPLMIIARQASMQHLLADEQSANAALIIPSQLPHLLRELVPLVRSV